MALVIELHHGTRCVRLLAFPKECLCLDWGNDLVCCDGGGGGCKKWWRFLQQGGSEPSVISIRAQVLMVYHFGGNCETMTKPSIQNDFSFYRRLRQRRRPGVDFSRKNSSVAYSAEDALLRQEIEELSDECCSKMSLFYAEATPMLKLISRYATQCHMVNFTPPAFFTLEFAATGQ
ncbi:unnamed protein product [Rodentolepis nana]|uniref:CYRIA-B_Rac1-bd domain-containing protein n=1 Tax=Rodentolepis nana TaxID=102285 RepID=A0A0R3U032_RODNA|nr:unnamed protein product [Rodentolepis nana]